MLIDALFHWVILNQGIPNSVVKTGDRAVIIDRLPLNAKQPEAGYVLEVFKQGETLDVVIAHLFDVHFTTRPMKLFWQDDDLTVAVCC